MVGYKPVYEPGAKAKQPKPKPSTGWRVKVLLRGHSVAPTDPNRHSTESADGDHYVVCTKVANQTTGETLTQEPVEEVGLAGQAHGGDGA